MKASVLGKLEGLQERYEEVQALLSDAQVIEKFGPYWNACQRFGLHQGWKKDGSPKGSILRSLISLLCALREKYPKLG